MTRSVETTSSEDSELSLPAPKERRRLREAADLTHDEVAAAVGVTAATIRSWESGRTAPRGRKREAYTRFLADLAARPEPAGSSGTGEAEADAEAGSGARAGAAKAPQADPPTDPPAEPPGTPGPPGTAEHPAPVPVPTPVPVALVFADAVEGPADAFDALYVHAARDLARQAYLLTGRRALALEAVEKAFTQAWGRWPEVTADPDPVGWVRTIVYEYALSPWHRFRRAHRHPDQPPAEPADRILLDALLSLPAVHRRTVLLYDGVGLDLPDTAAETEATTPTAGNRLVHAHADLADRIPELADVPPEKQSALLRDLLTALQPAVELDPRPAAAVRGGGERRTRMWTRATLSLTAMIAVSTAYTLMTAPTRYEPPLAPGESVSGVPPLSGPQQLTERSRQLHDKLLADPEAGPARIAPRIE
ncbi:helix-turn-helix domain-containing protein [Streptomyces sp. NPDC090036]|uniref:helix-turn-helix domain-containing protein n=1 Tax=Streptomyces sp. NPDC090036 TaxID=3365926 RepID=UPI00380F770D